ncbi:MAG: NTP transferase domain-containing protein [Methanoregulaceae archaeon]|nr:NTP transferase domain-containing protein [Methanoregulaceae archaeon]
MRALILAGGNGTRLMMGEKPLVTIGGKPMIGYVIDALRDAGCEVWVVVSGKTPYTQNWCRAHGIAYFHASGAGYIEDISETVWELGETLPFITAVSDIPCITSGIITDVLERYNASDKDACSTWVPQSLCMRHGCRTGYSMVVDGELSCPAGLNILRGDVIDREQEELQILIKDVRLAFNINTREELATVRDYLAMRSRD